MAAARINQRERCALIMGNNDIGGLRSPRPGRLAANPGKYRPKLPGTALTSTLSPEPRVHLGNVGLLQPIGPSKAWGSRSNPEHGLTKLC
jgi:hypothetical protein